MGETRKCLVLINTLLKILGSYPVSENDNKTIFCWNSFRTFCSLFSILATLASFAFSISEGFYLGYEILTVTVSCVALQVSFFFMAMHWPELRKECAKIDFYMGSYSFPKRLKLKLQITCIIFAITTFTIHWGYEFTMSSSNSFIGFWLMYVENFRRNPSFVTALNVLLSALRKISHFQTAMLRNLADVYIISVSMVLSARLRQIVERIGLLIEKKIQNEEAWMQTREDYQRLCAFIEKWDKILGYLVLSSFMSNISIWHLETSVLFRFSSTGLYHILVVAASLDPLLRCMAVCYIAGNVYAEGTRLVEFVVLTPPDVYNAEIDRIIVQLRQSRPALTGKQLFTLKHSLIVQVLGAVASHEIILLQYYSSAK